MASRCGISVSISIFRRACGLKYTVFEVYIFLLYIKIYELRNEDMYIIVLDRRIDYLDKSPGCVGMPFG